MRPLLILLTVLHCITCPCPPGFELVRDGECRGLYAIMYEFLDASVDELVAKCAEVEGKPREASAHLAVDRHITSQRMKESLNHATILLPEVVCGIWTKTATGVVNRSISCSHLTSIAQRNCSNQHRPSSDATVSYNEDGICYKVDANVESFKDAQTFCGQYGANLASIHNLQENSFIRRLSVSAGAVNGVFLGATKSGKVEQFGWTDGTTWDYSNFYPGFPVEGQGDCLAMDTLSTSGQWMNMNCSASLAAACARKENPKPVCTPGPWVEGQTIFSPGYPYDSSVPCDYFLTVADGKRVEVEILLLEANTCCDRLILTDDVLGGKIVANLTGEISEKIFTTQSSNLMRVSWQPNGGVNVRGMMMTFRGV